MTAHGYGCFVAWRGNFLGACSARGTILEFADLRALLTVEGEVIESAAWKRASRRVLAVPRLTTCLTTQNLIYV